MTQTPMTAQLGAAAMARLQQATQPQSGKAIFTSDLSVNEFVLVENTGFTPVGLVMGSSVYHVGFQVGRWNQSMELQVLSQAMYAAREYAMSRMLAEAQALNADGIVGVELRLQHHTGSVDLIDFVAIGTAVRGPQGGDWRAPGGRPFTSDLSGQDFWTLHRAGYLPVSLVLGTCVYHIAHQSLRQSLSQLGQNVEVPTFTQATYDAREIAMSRMQAEAERDQADGIVGVRVVESTQIWGEHATEFMAIGTAVRKSGTAATDLAAPMVLPLAR